MANYSNLINIIFGEEEKLKNFKNEVVFEDGFMEEQAGRLPEKFYAKSIEYFKKPALYTVSYYRHGAPIDEITTTVEDYGLTYIMADCFEGYETTIYETNKEHYEHKIDYYLDHHQQIKKVMPLHILNVKEIIFGILAFNKSELFNKPLFKKMLKNKEVLETFSDWCRSLTDEDGDTIPDPLDGSPLVGLNISYWDEKGVAKIEEIINKFNSIIQQKELLEKMINHKNSKTIKL